MTIAELQERRQKSLLEIGEASDAVALERLRLRFIGRNGTIPALIKEIRGMEPDVRPQFGRELQAWRVAFEEALSQQEAKVGKESSVGEDKPHFDFSLPGSWPALGVSHPISRIIEEAATIFARLGFSVAEGPDIEDHFHNFTALNTPDHHPSTGESDTFWLSPDRLLRTQTSPIQIRVMESYAPPVRVITPGRTYRRDTADATHSANFHQIEGLYVDLKPVSLADLKATLSFFAQEMIGSMAGVRFRPHFFPFTEPSVEVDFSCHICEGQGCRLCKMSGWIEIAGAGMVDPRVYGRVSQSRGDDAYNAEKVYGFAFGFGVERIAMIKYGIPDIRWLYENDTRFLEQCAW